MEKLLALAEKREVQSATTLVGQQRGRAPRGRGRRAAPGGRGDHEDEILAIAQVVEARRQTTSRGSSGGRELDDGGGEEVVLKGTGKAIQKVLEFGLWFKQREDRFVVRLTTGSVGAIDDIEVDENIPSDGGGRASAVDEELEPGSGQDLDSEAESHMKEIEASKLTSTKATSANSAKTTAEPVPESRIRYTSSLEVSVRRR